MHSLMEVRIANLRSIVGAQLKLSEYTVMVGRNNAGKSNVLLAIKWFLRPFSLGEVHFGDVALPIEVECLVAGIGDNVLKLLDEAHRRKIEPYCSGQQLRLRRRQDQPGASVQSIALEVRDPKVADDADEEAWKPTPTGIGNALKVLFPEPIVIGAMEDAGEDIGKAKSTSTIGKLISEIAAPLAKGHAQQLEDAMRGLSECLGADGAKRAPELVAMDKRTGEKLHNLFPGLSVRTHIETPTIEDVLKAGSIRIREGDKEPWRGVESCGHGAQRAIQMALVSVLAETRAEGESGLARTIMLVDEPELYLHPTGVAQVRNALRTLSTRGYQVVCATHSAMMLELGDVADALIVRKLGGKGTCALPTMRIAVNQAISGAKSQAETLFELENATEVLFADGVLFTEGRTEQRVLPTLFETVAKLSLASARIGLVSLNGVENLPKCMKIVSAMGIRVAGVVDLDFAFRGAVTEGWLAASTKALEVCKQVLAEIAEQNGIKLDNTGLPTMNPKSGVSASDAFRILAASPAAECSIRELHDELKGRGVWLWRGGSVEVPLGLKQKTIKAHAELVAKLRSNELTCSVADAGEIEAFVGWIKSATKPLA